MKRLPIVIVVLLALVGGGYFWWRSHHTTDTRGTFYGNVDIRDVSLAFRVGGRVAALNKREGEKVEAGEVVARLDPAPYRIALDQAQATASGYRASLARAEAGFRREEIAEARAVVEQRRAVRTQAEDLYKRTERLFASNALPRQELDNAKAAHDESAAGVQAAEATLDRLIRGNRVEDIALARAQLEQAEAAVAAAQLALEDTELKAPSAGTVLTRTIEPGTMLGAGSTVLVVSLDKPVWIRAFAPESSLGLLTSGAACEVYSDSFPDKPFAGHIGYVAAQAEFTPKNVETAELRTSLVYRFRVIVDGNDDGLRQGMPVTIRMTSNAKADGDAPVATRESAQ